MPNGNKQLVSVVVPVFNEELGIPLLQQRLHRLQSLWEGRFDTEFVFVDDGSSDGTSAALLAAFGNGTTSRFLSHAQNRGIGAAFRTGFAACEGAIVCTIDADCSYGPENLLRLIAALESERADIAVASPYHPAGRVEGVTGWRLMLSKGCSSLYRLICPVRLHTYTSVFRSYRRRVIETVSFREDGFVSATEILLRAAEQHYRIAEVPMTLHSRRVGQSKMKVARTVRAHLRMIARTFITRVARIGGMELWLPNAEKR
jgi:dolichol-phosphate mannosyltransferase